ncbi:hypothetical protein STUTZSP0542_27180 [Stutzerimonas marianensis]
MPVLLDGQFMREIEDAGFVGLDCCVAHGASWTDECVRDTAIGIPNDAQVAEDLAGASTSGCLSV